MSTIGRLMAQLTLLTVVLNNRIVRPSTRLAIAFLQFPHHKIFSEFISKWIIIEAKRELYLNSQPVKTIAFMLRFSNEYYFCRFVKHTPTFRPSSIEKQSILLKQKIDS